MKKEQTLKRVEKKRNKLKLAQLGQDVWRITYNLKMLSLADKPKSVAGPRMSTEKDMNGQSDKPIDNISCGLAVKIARRVENMSVAGQSTRMTRSGMEVEGQNIASTFFTEMACSMSDSTMGCDRLSVCLDACNDGRTDNLTSWALKNCQVLCAWNHSRACAWIHSRARRLSCMKDTNLYLYRNTNILTMTGPAGANQEEQVGREQGLEARPNMVEDLKGVVANKSRPAVNTRMAGDIDNWNLL